ncbi:MAG: hypothetical protein AAGI53_11020 [Planctomycetota bacterium]
MSDGIGLDGPPWGEPPSDDRDSRMVWSDIADELADHLACAERRETLGGACETQARERAIGRFGSPRSIALQLYWIAMKDKVIAYRSIAAGSVVVALAAVVAVFVLVNRQNATVEQVQTLMAQLAEANERVDPVKYQWGEVEADFGSLLDDAVIRASISGPVFGGEETRIQGEVDGGSVSFGQVHVGKYKLSATIERPQPWGRVHRSFDFTLHPGTNERLEITPPADEPLVPVRMNVNWPDDLRDAGLVLALDAGSTSRGWSAGGARLLVGPDRIASVETFYSPSTSGETRVHDLQRELHPSGALSGWSDRVMLPSHQQFFIALQGPSAIASPDVEIGVRSRAVGGFLPTDPRIFDGWRVGWSTNPDRASPDGVIEWTLDLPDAQWDHIRRHWRFSTDQIMEVDVEWPVEYADAPIAFVALLNGHDVLRPSTEASAPTMPSIWSHPVVVTSSGVATVDAARMWEPSLWKETLQRMREPEHRSAVHSSFETRSVTLRLLGEIRLDDEGEPTPGSRFTRINIAGSGDRTVFQVRFPQLIEELIGNAARGQTPGPG